MRGFADFWQDYSKEIIISTAFVVICLGLFLFLSLKRHDKRGVISAIFTLFILASINYILIFQKTEITNDIGEKVIVPNIKVPTEIKFSDAFTINISGTLRLIIINVALLIIYSTVLYTIFKYKDRQKEKLTTTKVALMGILVSVASVAMMFSVPIFPPAPYLKFEISGLIIYMVLLWYDAKTAIVVSLLTNIIHAFMPTGSAPVIPFLDELVNFIATLSFMSFSILFLKKGNNLNKNKIITYTVVGFIFTTIFMVLYNFLFNLPVVYHMKWKFIDVLYIFGLFNLIKWGTVALLINLLWSKLYTLKDIVNPQQKELTKY